MAAECGNFLWKKIALNELSKEEAFLPAKLLRSVDIELMPMRSLLAIATRTAAELNHPAYGWVYLFLAIENDRRLVTADERLLRALFQSRRRAFRNRAGRWSRPQGIDRCAGRFKVK